MTVPVPQWSDAARRCSEVITQHVADGNYSWGDRVCWAAISLADGSSDGVIYDTVTDARAHQLHETLCAYVRIPRDGMSPHQAESYLASCRAAYDAGLRIGVDDGPLELITPMREELNRAAMQAAADAITRGYLRG